MLVDDLIEKLWIHKRKNLEIWGFDEDGNPARVVDIKIEDHNYKTQGVHSVIKLIMEA